MQLEAIGSCPITSYPGEETNYYGTSDPSRIIYISKQDPLYCPVHPSVSVLGECMCWFISQKFSHINVHTVRTTQNHWTNFFLKKYF